MCIRDSIKGWSGEAELHTVSAEYDSALGRDPSTAADHARIELGRAPIAGQRRGEFLRRIGADLVKLIGEPAMRGPELGVGLGIIRLDLQRLAKIVDGATQ